MKPRRMYVMVQDSIHVDYFDRALVVWRRGVPGQVVQWTERCSGCTDSEDGHILAGPFGCAECGYTGRRRRREWVPLPEASAAQAFKKRRARWNRHKRK